MTKPFYSRYSQVGRDANGYPVGTPVPEGTDPATVKTGRAKGWKFVQAVPGRAEQVAEWNEVQEVLQDQIRDIGDYLLRDGQTVGLTIRADRQNRIVAIEWLNPNEPGRVYAFGMFHVVPEQSLTTEAIGTETVAVKIEKKVVTEVEDPTLIDPIVGEENYGEGGAYRWVYDVTAVVKNDRNRDEFAGTYDLWTLQDGEVRTSTNDQLSEVDRNLVKYTADLTGDCLVRGMRVRVEDASDDILRVIVDRGRAYVNGRPVGYETTTIKTIPKAKFDVLPVVGETIGTKSVLSELPGETGKPAFQRLYIPSEVSIDRAVPLKKVSRLVIPVVVRKRVALGNAPLVSAQTADATEWRIATQGYGPVIRVISVKNLVTEQYVPFEQRSATVISIPSVAADTSLEITWVYSALLEDTADFRVTEDRRAIEFLNEKPRALLGTLVDGVDHASYVYPGIARYGYQSYRLDASGNTVVKLDTVRGLIRDQKLYFKADDGTVEEAQVQEILSASVEIVLDRALTKPRVQDSYVYYDDRFIGQHGLTLLSAADNQMTLDYTWMLDRVDVVYIDQDNNVLTQSGQSNKPAYAPTVPLGVLPLSELRLPGAGDARDVIIKTFDVQRIDQQGLQKLLKRIEQAEYNASIQNLKLATYNKSTASGLNLRGILTEAAVNSDVVDITQPLAAQAIKDLAIDPDNGWMTPQLSDASARLEIDPDKSSVFRTTGQRATVMEHTLVGSSVIVNNLVTGTEMVRGATNPPKPTLAVLTGHYTGILDRPQTFPFFNNFSRVTDRVPSELEGGYWRVRQQRVPWLEQRAVYLPATNLELAGRYLTPDAIYTVAIDGQAVKDEDDANLTVKASATGTIAITLPLPDRTVSGHNSRTIALLDGNGYTAASTLYGANPSETSFLPPTGDSLSADPYVPLAQTFSFPRDIFFRGVNLHFAKVGVLPLEVQVRNTNAAGQPGSIIYTRRVLQPDEASAVDATRIEFPDAVHAPANVPLALCFVTADTNWQINKASVGRKDQNGGIVANRPLAHGALYISGDGAAWTVQTDSALTMQVLECAFSQSANRNMLVFKPVSAGALGVDSLNLLVARAQQLVPKEAAIDWSYSINDEVASYGLMVDKDGSLDPQVIAVGTTVSAITLRARLRGTATLSPQISLTNPRLLAFTPATRAIYTSRVVRGVPSYTKAKVTLELTSRSSVDLAAVKFSAVDDPYGVASFTLSGTPAVGDVIIISPVGVTSYSYEYEGAAETLADLRERLLAHIADNADGVWTTEDGRHVITTVTGEESVTFTFRRKDARAFATGEGGPDLTVEVTQKVGGNSTLALVGEVSFNYRRLVRNALAATQIDDQFTEHVFEGADLNGVLPGGNVFQVQVELGTSALDPAVYPKLRNLAVVVSS